MLYDFHFIDTEEAPQRNSAHLLTRVLQPLFVNVRRVRIGRMRRPRRYANYPGQFFK